MLLSQAPVCPEAAVIKYSIGGFAGFYSQLAGVLAGVAFAGLIFLLSAQLDKGKVTGSLEDAEGDTEFEYAAAALSAAHRMLFSAFLALTATSLGYADLGASTAPSGRAAVEEVVLGAGFTVAGCMLFYAIILTFDATHGMTLKGMPLRFQASTYAKDIMIVIFAPLVVAYTSLGLSDYTAIRYGANHSITYLDLLGWGSIFVQLLASWAVYPFVGRYRRLVGTSAQLAKATTLLGWGFLTIVFALVIAHATIMVGINSDPCGTLGPTVPMVTFLAGTSCVLMLTVQVMRFRTITLNAVIPDNQEASKEHNRSLEQPGSVT